MAGAQIISEARKKGLVIIAQVHSHAGDAFHSKTDDAWTFDTSEGFISIVVPEYGKITWRICQTGPFIDAQKTANLTS